MKPRDHMTPARVLKMQKRRGEPVRCDNDVVTSRPPGTRMVRCSNLIGRGEEYGTFHQYGATQRVCSSCARGIVDRQAGGP